MACPSIYKHRVCATLSARHPQAPGEDRSHLSHHKRAHGRPRDNGAYRRQLHHELCKDRASGAGAAIDGVSDDAREDNPSNAGGCCGAIQSHAVVIPPAAQPQRHKHPAPARTAVSVLLELGCHTALGSALDIPMPNPVLTELAAPSVCGRAYTGSHSWSYTPLSSTVASPCNVRPLHAVSCREQLVPNSTGVEFPENIPGRWQCVRSPPALMWQLLRGVRHEHALAHSKAVPQTYHV